MSIPNTNSETNCGEFDGRESGIDEPNVAKTKKPLGVVFPGRQSGMLLQWSAPSVLNWIYWKHVNTQKQTSLHSVSADRRVICPCFYSVSLVLSMEPVSGFLVFCCQHSCVLLQLQSVSDDVWTGVGAEGQKPSVSSSEAQTVQHVAYWCLWTHPSLVSS